MKKQLLALSLIVATAFSSFAQQLYDDFQSNTGATTFGSSSLFRIVGWSEGTIDVNANNPSTTTNTSTKVAQWSRPSGTQYPYVGLFLKQRMTDASSYASNAVGTPKISMYVYTDAPVGTKVTISLGDSSDLTYPSGIYTIFEKATTVQNAWELMTFDWLSTGVNGGPTGGTASTAVTKINVQLDNGGTTAYTLYFDDITGPSLVSGVAKASDVIAQSKVYPNPASGTATLSLDLKSNSNVKVVLNDLVGKEMKVIAEGNYSSINENFSVADLNKGMYIVTYIVNGSAVKTESLVVR